MNYGNKRIARPVPFVGITMNSVKRSLFLILWLISSASAAAPMGDAKRIDAVGVEQSLPTSNDALRIPTKPSNGVGQESIMRRLRVIIDDLQRQGPPPVGCMEG